MSKRIAKWQLLKRLEDEISSLSACSFEELAVYEDSVLKRERVGNGVINIRIKSFRENAEELMVMVSVDDGGWRGYFPISENISVKQ